MPTHPRVPNVRTLHPGWAAVAIVIVLLTTVGALTALWRFASNSEWWNIPGVIVGVLLAYWLAVPARRPAGLGREPSRLETRDGRSGGA